MFPTRRMQNKTIDHVCSLPTVSTYHIFSIVHTRFHKTQGKWTQKMRQESCEAHFLWKKTKNVGAVDRITCTFTITLNARRLFIEKTHGIWKGFRDAGFSWKKIRNPGAVARVSWIYSHIERETHFTRENTRKVNPRNAAGLLRGAFSSEKTRNVGAIGRITYKFTSTLNARRAFIEKTHGIWKGFRDARFSWKKMRNPGAVARVSYEFTITLNARRILPEKTQGIWGGLVPRHFHWKTQGLGGVGHPWHINLQSKWSLGAIYTVYTTISPGSLADWGGGLY